MAELRALLGSANRWLVADTSTTMVAGTSYLSANAADVLAASVTSLLNLNGANASTTFTDGIPANVWTAVGNAQISTAQSRFGGASALFDGAGDYISTPYAAARHDWSNVDYCFECWVRPTSLTTWSYVDGPNTIPTLYGLRNPTSAANFWSFGPRADGSLALYFFSGSATTIASAAGTITTGTWTHIAFAKSGTTVRLFANGTQVASQTITTPTFSPTTELITIGQANNVSINGHVDDARITRTSPRYTAAFPVPTLENSLTAAPDYTVPASIAAGDYFAVANVLGSSRVVPGAGRQIGTAGVGTAVALTAGQALRIVARNATQLDIV